MPHRADESASIIAPRSEANARARATIASAESELRRRLVLLTLARLAVATVLLAIVTAFGNTPASSPTINGVLGVVIALYAASLGYAIGMRRMDLRLLARIQIALDLAAWTALVYVTGGPSSPLSFFFGLSALTAALVLGDAAARNTAIIAVAFYGVLMVTMTYGVVPPLADAIHRPDPSRPELALQLVTNTLGILLISVLGTSLASRATRVGGALARAEASHAALSDLYEDVLRSIPVALFTMRPDGTIDGANSQAAALFDRPVDDLLGKRVTTLMPFVPTDAFRADREPIASDDVLTVGTKPPVPIAYRAAPLYDRSGRARGGLVVIEDRSNVESMRDAMLRAERLAGLGRLAAGLAHEIRNPLGAITGCVELVRESGSLGDEDRALLSTVVRESTRLNRLVSDMLVFAQPRQPEKVAADLGAIAREVITLMAAEVSKVPVTFRDDDAGEQNHVVEIDPGQIRQVLWNLIRNAVQASPAGSSVSVGVRTDGDVLELFVDDDGAGIAPEMRERIFDVFYSESARGTGLGLAIVKQIVDAHDAMIAVVPRDGRGTRFAVRFRRTAD